MSEFYAAIAGAVVGGIIAFVIQMFAIRQASSERKEGAKNLERTLATQILLNLQEATSNIRRIREMCVEAIAGAKALHFDQEPWRALLPVSNLPSEIQFNLDQFEYLFINADSELFMDVRDLEVIHNSAIKSFNKYCLKREELGKILPGQVTNMIAETLMSEASSGLAQVAIADLASLARAICSNSERDASECVQTLQKYCQYYNNLGGKTVSFAITA